MFIPETESKKWKWTLSSPESRACLFHNHVFVYSQDGGLSAVSLITQISLRVAFAQDSEHIFGHFGQIVIRLPTPLFSGG